MSDTGVTVVAGVVRCAGVCEAAGVVEFAGVVDAGPNNAPANGILQESSLFFVLLEDGSYLLQE